MCDEETSQQEQTRRSFHELAHDDNAVLASIIRKGQEDEEKEKEERGRPVRTSIPLFLFNTI